MDAMIRDFSLSLASDGKKPKTIRTYTDAAAWLQKTQGITHWASISRSAIREHMAFLHRTTGSTFSPTREAQPVAIGKIVALTYCSTGGSVKLADSGCLGDRSPWHGMLAKRPARSPGVGFGPSRARWACRCRSHPEVRQKSGSRPDSGRPNRTKHVDKSSYLSSI
jgi:hypothetical protein